ncbi:MAG: 8-amino-7-oxononanoate synthase [Cellvibrionaceae bacterium]
MSLDTALASALETRKTAGRYRNRLELASAQDAQVSVVDTQADTTASIANKQLINFASNDYLGLANHPDIQHAFIKAAEAYGVGSGASHLVCGHSREHHALEEELAAFTGRDRALLFSTGYTANIAVLNTLLDKNDGVLEDKLNHASLLDGGMSSGAQFIRFQHSNLKSAEQQLRRMQACRRKIIAVDAVFSMDGDVAPLPQLAQLASQNDAWLMADDAHGFGVLGKNGAGSAEHFDLNQNQLPIYMATLGKAVGSFGAFVAGSEALIETLIQFARPYIYTTAMPPAVAAATRQAIKIIQRDSERREKLSSLVNYFRRSADELGLPLMPSPTAIQPIVLGDDHRVMAVASKLRDSGFLVGAIRPPTVPEGSGRLRITLSANHSESQIDELLDTLQQAIFSTANEEHS